MPFPSNKALHSAYALIFLSTHHWDELEPYLGVEGASAVEGDQSGNITLDPKAKTFTIEFAGTANTSSWNWALPGTVFEALNKAAGTLFRARNAPLPQGENTFWMQQYPANDGGVGRTVIEFYTDNVITAVFKTNVDNFGTAGSGSWTAVSPAA
ncbi:hypothetical protein GALMADRAFT_250625 [Galerina marginata CBS 339.88]|uniref:Uncharacterized protein n=1 Tax=Galerina marginata (strain CBS 339.88) TaxID=685588 RepID=A0A067T211_GALM3|nr:hypothetical protein GALMADRAFT_250625 [Galerina marginata CBS 339.88]